MASEKRFTYYLGSVRKPLIFGFRHSGESRNPGFRVYFGNWIPAFAGMTLKEGLFGQTLLNTIP